MKILYFECKMGAAGDMIMSALFDLLDDDRKQEFLALINNLFPKDITVSYEKESKCSISGSHIHVCVHGQEESDVIATDTDADHHSHSHHDCHHHSADGHAGYSYNEICKHIEGLNLNKSVKDLAFSIFTCIGEAESKVHGKPMENIHFHEIGSLDAVCDVVGCSILLSMLDYDQIICSPINVGNGSIKCSHGILPVPAPATVEILKNVPYYTSNINSELCTPTGAAVLKSITNEYNNMPIMNVKNVGIGLGNNDFEAANCIRVFYGEIDDDATDSIIELSCNIDDMTGEELGFAMDVLLNEGALDVFFTAIQMKKNRPGTLFRCFCKSDEKNKFEKLIFKYTTTRGIRITNISRVKLNASFEDINTEYGIVRKKINNGYGIEKSKLEFEDLKKIALANDISLYELKDRL